MSHAGVLVVPCSCVTLLLSLTFICMCAHVCVHVCHSMHVEIIGQFAGVPVWRLEIEL